MKKPYKVLIIIGSIIGVIYLGISYRQSHKIVSPDIIYLKPSEIDSVIKSWIDRQGGTSSMLLGKVTKENKAVEYYLLLNNIEMTDIEIKPHAYDGIRIQVNISNNTNKKSNVIRITPTDKKLKYIILNDNRFEVSSINEIN